MNKFQQSELKGRELFKEVLESVGITDWLPTEDNYDRIDGYFSKNGIKAVVEIKTRDSYYADYPTHLMELDKYTAIVNTALNMGINSAYYACFFGDNTLYLYNVGKIKYNCDVDTVLCPQKTSSYSKLVWKKCLLIHKEIASVYIKTDGKWIKLEN